MTLASPETEMTEQIPLPFKPRKRYESLSMQYWSSRKGEVLVRIIDPPLGDVDLKLMEKCLIEELTVKKNVYRIPCFWTMGGVMTVEAENPDEAIGMAYDSVPLPDGDYVEGSFDVDRGGVEVEED